MSEKKNEITEQDVLRALKNLQQDVKLIPQEKELSGIGREAVVPAADINIDASEDQQNEQNTARLRRILVNYFNVSELRNLCFDFGVDYEDFSSSKSDLAREMVGYYERHGRLDSLWQEVSQRRPNAIIE